MQTFEVPLWPAGPTYTFKNAAAEVWSDDDVMPRPGTVNRVARNVSEPTLTVFPAEGDGPAPAAGRPAMIIAPGGGFALLAMDKEGYDVARVLCAAGVTAVVLKYRVRPTVGGQGGPGRAPAGVMGAILSDGQRAVRMVRARAAEWGIDPNRIGMCGFSAGSMLTSYTALHCDAGDPAAVDPVERVSSRPDFIGLLYGAVAEWPDKLPKLPPLFMMQANDDPFFGDPEGWAAFVHAWQAAGVPVEAHLYSKGGHGFGLGVYGGAVAGWADAMIAWLRDLGIIAS